MISDLRDGRRRSLGLDLRHWIRICVGLCLCTGAWGGLTGCKDEAVCGGVDCGDHGVCVASGGEAACDCEHGYHVEGLVCVADEQPPVNHPPEITNLPGTQDGQVGELASFQVVATDEDGDPLSWRVVSSTCGFAVTVDAGGLVSWTCDVSGDCSAEVEVADDFEPPGTDRSTLTIGCFESVPAFETTPETAVDEHVAYAYAVACSDPLGATVSLAVGANDDCGGTLGEVSGGSATYGFTPDELAGGTGCTLELECTNGEATVTQTAVVLVQETNEPPVLAGLPATVAVHWGMAGTFTLSATDVDLPANVLDFSVVSHDCGFTPALSAMDELEWTCGDVSQCTVTLRVTDDGAPAAHHDETLTIQCDNTAPAFTSTPAPQGQEGDLYEYAIICQDADGDPVSLALGTGDTCGGAVVDQGNGVGLYSFTPGSAGPCTLVVQCSDGQQATPQQATVGVTGAPGGEPTLFSGSNFNCARRADDTLACWGCNSYDEVVPPSQVFEAVTLGSNHGCGLTAGQSIVCWGNNDEGQTNAPAGSFVSLDAGQDTTCAVDTVGNLTCWGANYSQLVTMTPTSGNWTEVAVGSNHACALDTTGLVTCWGSNTYNQLDVPPATLFMRITAGPYKSCGLTTMGNLVCWGNTLGPGGVQADVKLNGHGCAMDAGGMLTCWGGNQYGQLDVTTDPVLEFVVGYGHTCYRETNGAIACTGYNLCGQAFPPAQPFTELDGGQDFVCGLDPAGEILCWGYDSDGKLDPPTGSFTRLGLALGHACALRADDTMACWGNNDYGQSTPRTGTFLQVDGGQRHSCALDTSHSLQCWGSGDGTLNVPTGTYDSFVSGAWHNCAVTAAGSVDCWGSNTDGQSTPVAGVYSKLGAGIFHTCGLKTDGTLACWGRSQDGMTAAPAGTYQDLATGTGWSCALDLSGYPVCWGANYNNVVYPPAGWGPFDAIRAGNFSTCGRDAGGTWWCWGRSYRQPI